MCEYCHSSPHLPICPNVSKSPPVACALVKANLPEYCEGALRYAV